MMNTKHFICSTNRAFPPVTYNNSFSDYYPFRGFDAAEALVRPSAYISGTRARTKTRISKFESRRINFERFLTSFTNNSYALLVRFLIFAKAEFTAKFLAVVFSVIRLCPKNFATINTNGIRKFITKMSAFHGTKSTLGRARVVVGFAGKIFLATIFTCKKFGIFALRGSAPFSGLCERWGRMAKVSIFSGRVINPFLSQNYCTTEVKR